MQRAAGQLTQPAGRDTGRSERLYKNLPDLHLWLLVVTKSLKLYLESGCYETFSELLLIFIIAWTLPAVLLFGPVFLNACDSSGDNHSAL